MAKQAMQRGEIIGKVIYAHKDEIKTAGTGTKYVDYNFSLKLPNGASIFTKSRLFNPQDPAAFTEKNMDMYDSIIEEYKTESIYVRKQVKPTKNKKTKIEKMAFDVIKGYYKKDGTVAFTLEGNIERLESEDIGEDSKDAMITIPRKTPIVKKFSEIQTWLSVEMVVDSINKETREMVLSDGTDDKYPLSLIGKLSEGISIDGAHEGQGYKFAVEIKKGKITKANEQEDSGFDAWESEAKVKKTSFAPDELILIPQGKVADLTSTKAPLQSVSGTDSLPF